MRYISIKKTLDNEDKKIYYQHFKKKKITAYLVVLGTYAGAYVFIEIKTILILAPFFMLVAIFIFFLSYSEFKYILKNNQKIVRMGRIKSKRKNNKKTITYLFLLEGSSLEIPVAKNIYEQFSKLDCVKLHLVLGNGTYPCHRAEKINP